MSGPTLRTDAERMHFCEAYFKAVNAIEIRASEGYREYELPRDVDKEMTDRPYYWMWVEKTNQQVPPSVLRLAFTKSALERENARLHKEALDRAEEQGMNDLQRMYFRAPTAEYVTLGSFRLDKIYASLEHRGQFAAVMPKTVTSGNLLIPWLMLNIEVSYRCDLAEQSFISIGVCLTNGQIVERFYDMISRIEMQPLYPMLPWSAEKIQEGFHRAQHHLNRKLAGQKHDWAIDAQARLKSEITQLRTYYRSILPDVPVAEQPLLQAEQKRKEAELTERTQPRIEATVRQMALVGLMER